LPRSLAEADHAKFVIAPPNENQQAEPCTTPTNRDLSQLAIVFAVVDLVQRGVEIEVDNLGKVQAALGQVAARFASSHVITGLCSYEKVMVDEFV
jgi:hypothetical protein